MPILSKNKNNNEPMLYLELSRGERNREKRNKKGKKKRRKERESKETRGET